MQGIKDKPKNILILSGDPIYSELNIDLNLEYISGKDLNDFYKEDVYSFGDFHWVDFDAEENLNNIDKLELAKILYLNHKGIPFDTFIFKSLNNKYAYIAHYDDYIVNVYVKNIEDYKYVIESKILKEFKGRKKYISNIPNEILEKIFDMCESGIMIAERKLGAYVNK